jgi:hypothetical protein
MEVEPTCQTLRSPPPALRPCRATVGEGVGRRGVGAGRRKAVRRTPLFSKTTADVL